MDHQKLSRRAFLRWSATTAGLATLAACGGPPSPSTEALPQTETQPTTQPAAAEVTAAPPTGASVLEGEIDYFMYDLGPANASREEVVKAFAAQNPGAKVKLTVLPYGELWEKLAAQMAAGQPPDVIYGDFSLVRYALEGQLLKLDDFFKTDPTLSKAELFTTNMTDDIQAKYGTPNIHALLLGTWVPILFYNRDLFDAAGEAHPTDEWTWADVREAAKRLTKPDAQQYGFQFGTTLDHVGWLWWEQKPADFWATPQIFPEQTTFNSEAGRGVMELFHNLGAVDKTAIPQEESDSYQGYGGGFAAGKVAMYSGGDWDAGWSFRELQFKWGMTMIPMMVKGYRPALNTMIASNAISAATKQPELAWAFMRFMSATPEGQTLIGQGAYETPVLKEVARSDAVLKPDWAVPGYDARVRAAELPGTMYTPYPLNLNLWEFPEKFLDPTILKLRTGEMKPDDAVAYLDKEGIPYFKQQKEGMKQ